MESHIYIPYIAIGGSPFQKFISNFNMELRYQRRQVVLHVQQQLANDDLMAASKKDHGTGDV